MPRPRASLLPTISFFAMYFLMARTVEAPWPYLQLAAVLAGVRLGRPLTVIVHELGHALFGRLAGLRIPTVELGGGLGLRVIRIGGCQIRLHGLFFLGGSTQYADLSADRARLRTAFGVAGGPLFNAAAGALMLASAAVIHLATLAGGVVAAALLGAALSQLSAMASSLWPVVYESGSPSDGKRLLDALQPPPASTADPAMLRGCALMALRRFAAAQHVFCEAFAADPNDPVLFSQALHCVSRASGDAAAFQYFIDHRERYEALAAEADAGSEARLALLRANIAWIIIKAGGPWWTAEAEALARAALRASPDAPEMKGTLGAILVRQGKVEAGLILLRDAARRISDPIDKADFCCFLAIGERARGDETRAQGFEALRQHTLAKA